MMMALTQYRVRQPHWLLWLVAFLLTGCNTTLYKPTGKSPAGQTVTSGSGGVQPARPLDLQALAKRTAASVIKRSDKAELGKSPTLYVDMIRNSTGSTLDTAKITNVLHTELARSGRFKLIPLEKNAAFQQSLEYQQSEGALNPSTAVHVDGELSPPSRFIFKHLMEKYDGDLMQVLSHVRVKRLFISEADRVGIGTFQPKDEKNQDSTELTGDINYRKIAEYGSDSDPRAFSVYSDEGKCQDTNGERRRQAAHHRPDQGTRYSGTGFYLCLGEPLPGECGSNRTLRGACHGPETF
jgi:PBP1b-binding outer membrane lipoprotein LpoB